MAISEQRVTEMEREVEELEARLSRALQRGMRHHYERRPPADGYEPDASSARDAM